MTPEELAAGLPVMLGGYLAMAGNQQFSDQGNFSAWGIPGQSRKADAEPWTGATIANHAAGRGNPERTGHACAAAWRPGHGKPVIQPAGRLRRMYPELQISGLIPYHRLVCNLQEIAMARPGHRCKDKTARCRTRRDPDEGLFGHHGRRTLRSCGGDQGGVLPPFQEQGRTGGRRGAALVADDGRALPAGAVSRPRRSAGPAARLCRLPQGAIGGGICRVHLPGRHHGAGRPTARRPAIREACRGQHLRPCRRRWKPTSRRRCEPRA